MLSPKETGFVALFILIVINVAAVETYIFTRYSLLITQYLNNVPLSPQSPHRPFFPSWVIATCQP